MLGVFVAFSTVARPASADVLYLGGGGPLQEPVPLYLRIEEQRAELRVYRREDRLDTVAPLVVCQGNCGFKLQPGPYKLQLRGPRDTDIQTGVRPFELRGPTSMYVDPSSSTARTVGLAMGIVGPAVMLLGIGLLAEGQPAIVGGGPSSDHDKQFAGGACLLGGAMLTVGGWIMFAVNGAPHLELQALRPQTPALAAR